MRCAAAGSLALPATRVPSARTHAHSAASRGKRPETARHVGFSAAFGRGVVVGARSLGHWSHALAKMWRPRSRWAPTQRVALRRAARNGGLGPLRDSPLYRGGPPFLGRREDAPPKGRYHNLSEMGTDPGLRNEIDIPHAARLPGPDPSSHHNNPNARATYTAIWSRVTGV